MQDTLADMITRIRNAQGAGKATVAMPSSKVKASVAETSQTATTSPKRFDRTTNIPQQISRHHNVHTWNEQDGRDIEEKQ
jgi:hypothetical protein